jgi:hypothetical protein
MEDAHLLPASFAFPVAVAVAVAATQVLYSVKLGKFTAISTVSVAISSIMLVVGTMKRLLGHVAAQHADDPLHSGAAGGATASVTPLKPDTDQSAIEIHDTAGGSGGSGIAAKAAAASAGAGAGVRAEGVKPAPPKSMVRPTS